MARPGWLVGVVVFALLLTGCFDAEPAAEPPRRPSAPTSPVTTTSPTQAAPELPAAAPEHPAAARRNTKAGAVAFAHHYIDLINHVRESGDVNTLRQRSSHQCGSCAAIAEVAETTYADGGYLRGGMWTVLGSSAWPITRRRQWQVVAKIRVAGQIYLPRSGARVEERRAEVATLIFVVARSRGHWTVTSLERHSHG